MASSEQCSIQSHQKQLEGILLGILKKKERKKEFRIKLQRQCHRELVVPIVEEVGGGGQREIPPEAVTFIKTRLFNRAGAFQYFAMR